jgi:flagellar hook-length control protein FliK
MELSSRSFQTINPVTSTGNIKNENAITGTVQGTAPLTNLSPISNVPISSLSQGQVFQGVVTDIRNNQVTIQINDQTVQAKFQEMVDVCIGETLQFVVKENNGKQVTIAPLHGQTGNQVDSAIYKALEAAGLPSTDKNIDIVNELLQNSMPVDKDTIKMLLSASLRNPDISIKQLTTMLKHEITLSNSNIEVFEQFLSSKENLTVNLKNLMSTLPNAMNDIYQAGNREAFTQLLDVISKGGNQSVNQEFKQLLDSLQGLMKDSSKSELVTNLLKSDAFQKGMVNELMNQWTLSPEQLNKEHLSHFYADMGKQMSELQNALPKDGLMFQQMQQSMESLKEHMQQFQNMNQQLSTATNEKGFLDLLYTQLPIKMKGQVTQSDLYVYANRKGSRNTSDSFKLLLHLDMEHLGDLDVLIRLKDNNLDAQFMLSDEEAYELIRDNLGSLTENLKEKGYFFTASAKHKVAEEKESIAKELFEDEANMQVKRYSFDIRA